MNHDIAHCRGYNCQLRDLCVRYLAHKEIECVENNDIPYWYVEPQSAGSNCESFWRSHEEN